MGYGKRMAERLRLQQHEKDDSVEDFLLKHIENWERLRMEAYRLKGVSDMETMLVGPVKLSVEDGELCFKLIGDTAPRLHLKWQEVNNLVPVLQRFLDTGSLEEPFQPDTVPLIGVDAEHSTEQPEAPKCQRCGTTMGVFDGGCYICGNCGFVCEGPGGTISFELRVANEFKRVVGEIKAHEEMFKGVCARLDKLDGGGEVSTEQPSAICPPEEHKEGVNFKKQPDDGDERSDDGCPATETEV